MDEAKGIFNIGDLAQPVTTLIEKIADATGVLYEPRGIVKRAEAEAKAELIKANNQIEINDLQRRALNRFVHEEGKKQENFESIMGGMIPLLGDGSKPNEISDDWLMNYVDKAKLVSDKEMQILWAKILAGEANKLNTFSKRTVNFIASMDKKDAEMFSNLCKFNVVISGDTYPLVYEVNNPIYEKSGIDFATLTHLDSIGLVRFDNITTTTIAETDDIAEISCNYSDNFFQIVVKSKDNLRINIGFVMITQLGLELSKLCETDTIPGFYDYLLGKLGQQGNLEIKRIDSSSWENHRIDSSVSTSQTDFVKNSQIIIDGGEF
jgi:Protein of unknown function (DUF2806)